MHTQLHILYKKEREEEEEKKINIIMRKKKKYCVINSGGNDKKKLVALLYSHMDNICTLILFSVFPGFVHALIGAYMTGLQIRHCIDRLKSYVHLVKHVLV